MRVDEGSLERPGGLLAPVTGVGWYGKIPAAGDFVTRRLPPQFVKPWDRWLQTGILESRRRLGERWPDVYLTFPVWRFLLPCGLLGATGWTGVLMPSVDRVGRYFPLTLAASLNRSDFDDLGLGELDLLLDPMEAAGLAALEGEPTEQVDLQIRNLPYRPSVRQASLPPMSTLADESVVGHWTASQSLPAELALGAGQHLLSFLGRRTLWWLSGGEQSGGTIRLDRWPMADDAFDILILQD